MSKKQFVRCIRRCRDGSPCGRMAPADTQVCSVHAAQQAGTLSGIAQPADLDELEIIRKLARSANESIRLRAAELLIDLRKEAEAKHPPAPMVLDVRYLDEFQKEQLRHAFEIVEDVKREVRSYIRAGGRPFASPDNDDDWQEGLEKEPDHERTALGEHKKPTRTAEAVSEPTAAKSVRADELHDGSASLREEVTPDRYDEVGLFRLPLDGVARDRWPLTHALGDAHAAQILNGDISLEDARAAQTAAMAEADATRDGYKPRSNP